MSVIVYRTILQVIAIVAAVSFAAQPAGTHGSQVRVAYSHSVSTTSKGLTLTLETPRAAYPRDALVSVTVTLRNVSNSEVRVEECAGFQPVVQLLDAAGAVVKEPAVPTGNVHPACFDPTVPVQLSVGQVLTWTDLMILHSSRLRAIATLYGKSTGEGFFGGPSFSLQTPTLRLGTVGAPGTRATIETSPHLHALVQAPVGGRVYYTDRTECAAQYGGAMVGGTDGWTTTGSRALTPSVVTGCAGISRWQLAVAVEGSAPVWIDYRAPPQPLPPGGTISAPECRSNSPPGVGAVAVSWHGRIYVVAANGGFTCRLATARGAGDAHLSPDGRWVAWLAPEPARHWIHDLWVGRVDGKARPRRIAGAPFSGRNPALIWSPGSRMLAYGRAGSIFVVRAGGGSPRWVSSAGRHGAVPLAWWPNGSAVVAQVYGSGGVWPHRVNLSIDGLGGTVRSENVSFPAWISNPRVRPIGSYPLPTTTIGADGRHVFLATTGGGVRVSGVWEAAVSGARGGDAAHLVIGTRARVQGHPAPAEHLAGATHVFGSPDGRYLVVDPTEGFWVVDTRTLRGKMLRVPIQRDCVVSQSIWPAGARGVTFVQTCSLNAGAAFRSTLWSVGLNGGAPRRLLTAIDRLPDAISIDTVYRCVRCGFNPGS